MKGMGWSAHSLDRALNTSLRPKPQIERICGIYVITEALPALGRSHTDVALAAIAGGARVVQYREKDPSQVDAEEVGSIRHACRDAGVVFIVNDDPDLARRVEADGVHIGEGDVGINECRASLGPDGIVGLSAGSRDEVIAAFGDGADSVGVGPIFATDTKPDGGYPLGLATLSEMVAAATGSVVAIGGIGPDNAAQVAQAGADALAVISAVSRAEDMESAVKKLVGEFERGRYTRNDPA